MKKLIVSIINFLCPRHCICCSEIIENGNFCESCYNQFAITDITPTVMGNMSVYSCFTYTGGLKRAVNRFKFNGYTRYTKAFAHELHKTLLSSGVVDYQAVIYVPMPEQRKLNRGYNQAELLAQQLAQTIGIPCIDAGLRKENTISNHDMNVSLRIKYGDEGYTIKKSDNLPQNVILVDDIYSTGTTLKACQSMLNEAGVKKITAIVLAKS